MPKWEQFVVKCFDWQQKLGKLIWHCFFTDSVFHDAFTSVVPKPTPNVTKRKADNPFGISLFIIDSTARTHFLRHMPLTGQFLRDNGFRLMQGYTKAIDAVNITHCLTSSTFNRLATIPPSTCWPSSPAWCTSERKGVFRPNGFGPKQC